MANRYGDEGYDDQQQHGGWDLRHGLHRGGLGKAPKGYTRSDERIREDICERLMTSPYDASDVEITVSRGEVTLTGTVSSRADKWGIEDVAESILGVQDVHNQIRVNRGDARTSGTTLGGDTGHLHS
jgi:osmotically-inducible protein OsmY